MLVPIQHARPREPRFGRGWQASDGGRRRQRVMMGPRWWAYILALVLVVLLAPAAPAQFADLIDRVRPSVGFILVTLQDGSAFSGSGFVIRSDGDLLSASHVFDGGATTITVTF